MKYFKVGEPVMSIHNGTWGQDNGRVEGPTFNEGYIVFGYAEDTYIYLIDHDGEVFTPKYPEDCFRECNQIETLIWKNRIDVARPDRVSLLQTFSNGTKERAATNRRCGETFDSKTTHPIGQIYHRTWPDLSPVGDR